MGKRVRKVLRMEPGDRLIVHSGDCDITIDNLPVKSRVKVKFPDGGKAFVENGVTKPILAVDVAPPQVS